MLPITDLHSTITSHSLNSIPKPRSMVAQGVTWLLVGGAVFLVAWISTYFRYADKRSLLTENVLVLNLFVLPIILTGVIAFGRYLYNSFQALQAEEEQSRQQVIAADKSAETARQERAADRRFDHVSIIASAVYTPLGNSAADIIAALDTQGPMAALALDVALLDQNGHSLITSRIHELDEQNANELTLRISAILRRTLDELLSNIDMETLQSAIRLCNSPISDEAKLETEIFYQQQAIAFPLPELHVHLLLPDTLPAQSLTMLSNQLREQINASALSSLNLNLTLHHDQNATFPMVNEAINALRESTNQVILIAGSDSLIDESQINTLLSQNKIRTTSDSSNRLSADKLIPGEGGAAMLMVSSRLMQYGVQSFATLHRPAVIMDNESGDALISRAHAHASTNSTQPICEITQAFCDSPHSRSSQSVAQALSIALHHIDPIVQRVSVNQTFGYLGTAGNITSLALAALHIADSNKGAVCINAQDQLIAAVTLLPVITSPS